MMKSVNIRLLIANIFGISFLALMPANAAILVEPIVTTPNESFPNRGEIGSEIEPEGILLGNAPDAGNQQNFLNSTGYTFNKISVFLVPQLDFVDEDVVWGDVNGDGKIGLSNIFGQITIAPDLVLEDISLPRLDFTDGTIPNENRFILQFITNPDLTPIDPQEYGPLVTGFSYDGFKSVPEPSNFLGFAAAIMLSIWLRKNKPK